MIHQVELVVYAECAFCQMSEDTGAVKIVVGLFKKFFCNAKHSKVMFYVRIVECEHAFVFFEANPAVNIGVVLWFTRNKDLAPL